MPIGAGVVFGNDLITQTLAEGRAVPAIVTKCVAAVETYGVFPAVCRLLKADVRKQGWISKAYIEKPAACRKSSK